MSLFVAKSFLIIMLICGILGHINASTSGDEVPTASVGRSSVSDVELDTALNNPRFIKRQLQCALGTGKCDPIGRRLKALVPLVLRGACTICTPEENKQILKTIAVIQQKYPSQWAQLINRYAKS